MAENDKAGYNLYALLIGIDCYLPNESSGIPNSMNLSGCVSDINRVEDFLRNWMGTTDSHILKLTAMDVGAAEPAEPADKWPTRENILNGFKWLGEAAAPGDHIYIHYSGHGGRVKTPPKFQHLKWGEGFDEVLVPTDYSLQGDRFLRDFELAHILGEYVKRQLIITVILDSCHSGGATRGEGHSAGPGKNGVSVRSIGVIKDVLPPPEIPVATDEELAASYQALSGATARDFDVGSGWLLEPEGYLLLAACRASEYAYEHCFNETEQSGVLTYWLLDSLKSLGTNVAAKTLYDRILAKVHSHFWNQTPQLQGATERSLFGSEPASMPPCVNVMQIIESENEVILNVGQAQGVSRGARFAIYPQGEPDFTRVERRRALATIKTVGATSSHATITEKLRDEAIEQGDQAVLLESGTPNVRRTLRLVPTDQVRANSQLLAVLQELKDTLTQRGSSFLQLASDGTPADFLVSISEGHEFVISDASDTLIPNLRPSLRVSDASAPFRLVERLLHLTKYLNVQELDNCDPFSPLRRQVSAELLGVQAEYVMGDKPTPQPFDKGASVPALKTGEWTFLKISNNSAQVLNITVLDLRPNWSIRQIYPAGAAFYEPLDPGQSILLPLHAALPQGYDEGRDVIKVLGTVGASNFRLLELPALDEPDKSYNVSRGEQRTRLEEFLAAFMNEGSGFRDFSVETTASHEWTMAQVEINVQRD